MCIGINPSTAVPDRLDNTLKSAQRIALFNGYDSFIMFNVYAQRATDPDDMEKTMNPVAARGEYEGLYMDFGLYLPVRKTGPVGRLGRSD